MASKKRARESDDAHAETAEKLTKAQKKKLKAESGAAVPSASDVKVDAAKTNGDAVKEKKDKKETAKKPETKTLEGGIQITDVTVGKGPQAKKGNTVNMRYIGKFTNGKVFDSNTKGAPVCGFILSASLDD